MMHFREKIDNFLVLQADSLKPYEEQRIFTYNRFKDNFSYSVKNHQWLEEVVIVKKVKRKDLEIADLANDKKTAKKEDIEAAQTIDDLWLLIDPGRANDSRTVPFYRLDGIMQYNPVPLSVENEKTYNLASVIPDYTWVRNIDPLDIEKYTIIRNETEAQQLYGFGFKYVIDIKLKPFDQRTTNRIWNNPVTIKKFAVAKTFYEPKYDTDAHRYSTIPDLRKTILWNPDVKFNHDGIALIHYFNGDRYTRIKCVFEGIDNSGMPVHSEYMYNVELK